MHQIRTVLKYERTSPDANKERGARYWAAAEILSPTWFVVESCIEVSSKNEVQRWVTTSIQEAVQIQQRQGRCHWSHIFVCIRAPRSIQNGTIFEELKEAYQAGSSDSFVLKLQNGMSFMTGEDGHSEDEWPSPKELRLLYAHQH